MTIKCAWCGERMGEKPGREGTENDTTHGICVSCHEREINKARAALANNNPVK